MTIGASRTWLSNIVLNLLTKSSLDTAEPLKGDTYGTEVFVRFREVFALERFELKSSQI